MQHHAALAGIGSNVAPSQQLMEQREDEHEVAPRLAGPAALVMDPAEARGLHHCSRAVPGALCAVQAAEPLVFVGHKAVRAKRPHPVGRKGRPRHPGGHEMKTKIGGKSFRGQMREAERQKSSLYGPLGGPPELSVRSPPGNAVAPASVPPP